MSIDQDHRRTHTVPHPGRSPRGPRQWKLWTAPLRLIVYLLAVEAITVTLIAATADRAAFGWSQLRTFLLIVALGVVAAELTRHVERMRRRVADTPHVNMSSVWTLAAALVLPTTLAAATAAILYIHLSLRSWYRVRGAPLYRLIFSACTVILACLGASTTLQAVAPQALSQLDKTTTMAAFALAVAVYSTINSGLVAAAIGILEGRLVPSRMLGSARENAVEFATLGLGLCTTTFLATQPLLILAQLPALMLLHHCVLARQLEEAATTDHHTGLLNATAWTNRVTAQLAQAARDRTTVGILMIDLDHLTHINTTHGRHTGDRVLQHVADTIRRTVRTDDLVARFGGEEFVVACRGIHHKDLIDIAERIRADVQQLLIPLNEARPAAGHLSVSVSVGAALHPEAGCSIENLLLAADSALFAAKDGGRNQVQSIGSG